MFQGLTPDKNKPVFKMPEPSFGDKRDVEKAFARLFTTEDGMTVLSHLQAMVFLRAYGAESSDQQIRYAEGQRALVAQILRLINSGRTE